MLVLTMSFSDPLWLLLSRVGKIRTDGHWAYWECFIVLCKNRLKNTWIHWEKKASGKGRNLRLKLTGPHGSSLLETGAWLWGQAFGDISGCLTPRVQAECVAQLATGTFWMALLFRAYGALAPVVRDSLWFCRAGNGALSSKGECLGGFRYRSFDSVILRVSLPAK